MRHIKFLTASTLAVMAGLSSAYAQSSEDVIVVTATKRAQAIEDVPFSVNAQTETDLRRTGSNSLEDAARNVAGLTIQNLGPGQSQVAVRGVSAGQIVRDQPGVKEQVGIYLDESVISLSLFTPDLDLFDLNRIETLRGPQGTLFGSGSVGGTIRYITNQPSVGEQSASIEADMNAITDGGFGGHVKGMANAPIGDNAAVRLVGYHTQYGGYIDGVYADGRIEDVNSGTRSGLRAALTMDVSDNVSITPRIIYQEIDANGFNRQEQFNFLAGTNQPGEREQYLLQREEFTDETLIADVLAEVDFQGASLTSITSYSDRDILVSRDASALTHSVSLDLGYDPAVLSTPSNLRDTTAYESWTQELRLASNGDGPLQWVAGIFYADTSRVYAQRLPTDDYDSFTDAALGAGTAAATANGYGPNSPFNSDLDYQLTQTAIFGEVNWDATERLTLTAGGRYYDFEETRLISSGGLFANGDSNTRDETASDGFTPRFLAAYELSEGVTLNAQASQGFRLGGVNDPLNANLCSDADRAIFGGFQDYGDETLWNYEAGVKVNKNGVTFAGAAFYNDITDLQVTLDAGTCSSRVVFNVPEAHTMGVEAELGFAVSENLDVFLTGSLIEAEFDATVVDGSGAVIGGIEEGNRLPSVPETQLAASAVYYLDNQVAGAEAYFAGSVQYVGTRFTQPGDQVAGAGNFSSGLAFGGLTGAEVNSVDLELDAYTTLNLSAGLEWDDMTLSIYANNVTDENALLSFDRERGGRARLGFRTNQPRTIGVRLRKDY